MNAPSRITADANLRERLLASCILAGDVTKIPDPEGYYSDEEWRAAAQCAADSDDWGELRFMVRHAEVYADFVADTAGTDFDGDMSEWLASDRGNFDAGARHPDSGSV